MAPHTPTEQLMNNLYALQHPVTSNWRIPFIRLFSRHKYDCQTGKLAVIFFVYFTRLVFELISDVAIKCIMEHITFSASCKIKRCTSRIKQPRMFSRENFEMLQHSEFRFSLPGLLKHVESTGYGYGIGYDEDESLAIQSKHAGKSKYTPPPGLKVDLFDFQKSTYLWMMDQEREESGLNGHFWEEWQFGEGDGLLNLYYFPLGGEFRFTKPPLARGGLLCEEMGLGMYTFLLRHYLPLLT